MSVGRSRSSLCRSSYQGLLDLAISVGSDDDELSVFEADEDVRLAGGDGERGDADVERHRSRRPKIVQLLDHQLAVAVT